MPSWLLKAGIQGAISLLPNSRRINYLFQRRLSRNLQLTEPYFESKLKLCSQHLANYRAVKQSAREIPKNALEIGTGWLPIVPIGLFLCGVDEVITVDVNPLLRVNLIQDTIDLFIRSVEARLLSHLPLQPERLAALYPARNAIARGNITEAFAQLRIKSVVADARSLPYEAGSIDFFVSNNTFEHIPPDVLHGILVEYRRVATSAAVMSHMIDLSDHYSHFDKRITPYHFLRFSPSVWRVFNNELHYQNRLRVSDYRRIHQQARFDIVEESNTTGTVEQITALRVGLSFRDYSHDDLIVTASWMVSIPSAN